MLIVIMGGYFNVFITFPYISMTYPIVVHLIIGLYSHSFGICIKVFVAVSGEEYCEIKTLVSNVYVNAYHYNSVIINYRLALFI